MKTALTIITIILFLVSLATGVISVLNGWVFNAINGVILCAWNGVNFYLIREYL